MILKNAQYDAVMRHFDMIRSKNYQIHRERVDSIYALIPEIQELDKASAERSNEAARTKILTPAAYDPHAYKADMDRITARRKELLREAGYPEDYLEIPYNCPLCKDKGFIGNRHCACFDLAAADIVYGRSSLLEIIKSENFDHFSFDYYSDRIEDDTSERSPRDDAKIAYRVGRAFSETIGKEGSSLYIYGNTGVGKTFLTHCIAADAIALGYSVLDFSAGELFNYLADTAFGRTEDPFPGRQMIDDCDLLIIDDLGTELANAFVGSELFRIVQERTKNRRSTIISTNLALNLLSDKYSERIFSRILSDYKILRLSGGDIRIMKKLGKIDN